MSTSSPSRASRAVTSADILNAIEEQIVFGTLLPKSRLVEEDLAAAFSTKRHVIRDAFAELEKLGLISRIRNRGALVSELTPSQVRDIYDLRELLETTAAARTPLPIPAQLLEEMTDIQNRHSSAFKEHDFRNLFRLNIKFHQLQFGACTNRYLVEAIEIYARKAHLIRAVKYGDAAHLTRVVDQHWAIIEALGGSDHDKLVAIVKAHLPGSPEEYIRRYELRHGREIRSSDGGSLRRGPEA